MKEMKRKINKLLILIIITLILLLTTTYLTFSKNTTKSGITGNIIWEKETLKKTPIKNISIDSRTIKDIKDKSCEEIYEECKVDCGNEMMNTICKEKCSRQYIECRK